MCEQAVQQPRQDHGRQLAAGRGGENQQEEEEDACREQRRGGLSAPHLRERRPYIAVMQVPFHQRFPRWSGAVQWRATGPGLVTPP